MSETPLLLDLDTGRPKKPSCTRLIRGDLIVRRIARLTTRASSVHRPNGVGRGRHYQVLQSAAESRKLQVQRRKHRDKVCNFLMDATTDQETKSAQFSPSKKSNTKVHDDDDDDEEFTQSIDIQWGDTDSSTMECSVNDETWPSVRSTVGAWWREEEREPPLDSLSAAWDPSLGERLFSPVNQAEESFWDEEAWLVSQLQLQCSSYEYQPDQECAACDGENLLVLNLTENTEEDSSLSSLDPSEEEPSWDFGTWSSSLRELGIICKQGEDDSLDEYEGCEGHRDDEERTSLFSLEDEDDLDWDLREGQCDGTANEEELSLIISCDDGHPGEEDEGQNILHEEGLSSIPIVDELAIDESADAACCGPAQKRRPKLRLNLAKRGNWKYVQDANEFNEWQAQIEKLKLHKQEIADQKWKIHRLRFLSKLLERPLRRGFPSFQDASSGTILFSILPEEAEEGIPGTVERETEKRNGDIERAIHCDC